jgi:hypothetical protein
MSIESVGFMPGSSRNAARFLEGDLRQLPLAMGGGPWLAGEAAELLLAEEVGTSEIRCQGEGGTTEIRCPTEEIGTTEIRCHEKEGTTEIRCPTEEIGTTEIRCGTTEIRCS